MTTPTAPVEPMACPFCGGAMTIIASEPYWPRFVKTWRPQCRKCGTCPGEFDSETEARTFWNTRASAPQPAPGGVREAEPLRDAELALLGITAKQRDHLKRHGHKSLMSLCEEIDSLNDKLAAYQAASARTALTEEK